jgi:hypothetical protein
MNRDGPAFALPFSACRPNNHPQSCDCNPMLFLREDSLEITCIITSPVINVRHRSASTPIKRFVNGSQLFGTNRNATGLWERSHRGSNSTGPHKHVALQKLRLSLMFGRYRWTNMKISAYGNQEKSTQTEQQSNAETYISSSNAQATLTKPPSPQTNIEQTLRLGPKKKEGIKHTPQHQRAPVGPRRNGRSGTMEPKGKNIENANNTYDGTPWQSHNPWSM